jgi:hypothetical protein
MHESRALTVGLDVDARSVRLAAVRADELLEGRMLHSLARLAAFLEDSEDVSGRVAEGRVRQALSLVRAWQDDLSPSLDDLLETCIDVVNPNKDEHACVPCWLPVEHPFAAHLCGRIVERLRPVAPRPARPAEREFVEAVRCTDVGRRDLQVANLCSRH